MANDGIMSERNKKIIMSLNSAMTSVATAQAEMRSVSPMSVHIPLFRNMTESINEMRGWVQEIQRLPW